MDSVEQRRKLFTIGFGTATPPFWGKVVQTQLARLVGTQTDFADLIEAARTSGQPIPPGPDGYDPRLTVAGDLLIDGIYLVHAVRQLSTLTRKLDGLVKDSRIGKALRKFDSDVPDIVLLRDLIEHLDEYAFGQGTKHKLSDPDEQLQVTYADENNLRGELLIRFGGRSLRLIQTARAAIDLAIATNQPWWDAWDRPSQEAQSSGSSEPPSSAL